MRRTVNSYDHVISEKPMKANTLNVTNQKTGDMGLQINDLSNLAV